MPLNMKGKEIIIKTDEIGALAKEGEKFIFQPEAEEKLIELLMLQDLVNSTVEDVKEAIAKAGTDINPNFKGVIGDRVRLVYRQYGAKYKYDWKKKNECKPFLKEKTSWYVDTDKIEKYVEEVGELPEGIEENDRPNKLSISFKDEEERQLLDE